MADLYIDADACPVKEETYRVAKRHGLHVFLVAHTPMRAPEREWITHMHLSAGPDAADDWIAEHIQPGDICITTDIPLAHRCIQKGALALGPKGRPFSEDSIGEVLAMRDLLTHLRDRGEITGGPAPFTKRDRSRFLSALHEMIVKLQRQSLAKPPDESDGL
ncbi:YaiI/YqxD family protein [Candidatus Sumerlaeota bacterium]|nr:YaiI/YqxD family protein [Candidatus Sumerlaeota bacterium]